MKEIKKNASHAPSTKERMELYRYYMNNKSKNFDTEMTPEERKKLNEEIIRIYKKLTPHDRQLANIYIKLLKTRRDNK